ncbi:MAG: histidine phosphatase family protein [Polaromonas sp.]|jgi:phosphohistidine phosphatase|uniref:SixA phosphatase family protein n=1 Tax=Polaromonas sp. TaxID=1869339 RepID=UPI002731057B|nr:histidine phosphatase family protein [Polaromonas sp.]MDP2254588.1 histidine phosphatase family protein [Polaromonas sp.]MDP3708110.1 histidine phosphatase family protein [Polaromonas sp.]
MDLILWRHAEAEEGPEGDPPGSGDLERALTSRGEKQAFRMASWLDRQLPEGTRIMVSPARRCEQTALALGRKYKVRTELAPGAAPAQLLELVQWPLSKSPILVIGHQPTLGQTIAQLLGLQETDCPVKKGALWWLRSRDRDGRSQTVVVTVQSPEVL